MALSGEQLAKYKTIAVEMAKILPQHVREGFISCIHNVYLSSPQKIIGKNLNAAAEVVVAENRETFNSYADDLKNAGVTAEQLTTLLILIALNSNDWEKTIKIFVSAKLDDSIGEHVDPITP